MNLVDNFQLMENSLPPLKEGEFFFGQIMARKKDGSPFAQSNNKIIKDLIFKTKEGFAKKKPEIVAICNALTARAYINPNSRNFRDITLSVAGVCLDYLRAGGEMACKGAFATACGRAGNNTIWIFDIDEPPEKQAEFEEFLAPHLVVKVPTVNGAHFLTNKFDIREFRLKYPDIDIHKNNPTLLYSPPIK